MPFEYMDKRNENGFIDLSAMLSKKAMRRNAAKNTIGTLRKEWITCEDGIDYLFKETASDKFSFLGEVIMQDFCEQMGFPSAEYDLAILEGKIGTLSKNYLNNRDSTELSGVRFVQGVFPQGIEGNRVDSNNLGDVEKAFRAFLSDDEKSATLLTNTLKKLHILDFMAIHPDRHPLNWAVIVTTQGGGEKQHILAPAYDNCGILLLHNTEAKLGEYLKKAQADPDGWLDKTFLSRPKPEKKTQLHFDKAKISRTEDFRRFCSHHSQDEEIMKFLHKIQSLDVNKTMDKLSQLYLRETAAGKMVFDWARTVAEKRKAQIREIYQEVKLANGTPAVQLSNVKDDSSPIVAQNPSQQFDKHTKY